MSQDTFPVLVMTSDKYIDAVRPFMHLFRKYWPYGTPSAEAGVPQEVIIAGFTPPPWLPELGKNVRFESLGEFKDFPIDRWSDALRIALTRVQSDYVVIMLEDYWLTHPVNLMCVHDAFHYMQIYPGIIKFDLMADRLYAKDAILHYRKYGTLDIVWSKPGSPYHLSLMTGIWRKRHLLDVLKPGWSPWDIEISGTTELSKRADLEVLGSHQWPVQHTLAFRHGDIGKIYLADLKQQDHQRLKELNLLDPWR